MKQVYEYQIHGLWKFEIVGGRTTKVPYSPSGVRNGTPFRLSSSKPEQWSPRSLVDRVIAEEILEEYFPAVLLGKLPNGKRLCGIDIDGWGIDEIQPILEEVVERFGSYTEISPSKEGVKIYFLMEEEEAAAIPMSQVHSCPAGVGGHVELTLHRSHRFFALTGDTLDGLDTLKTVPLEVVSWFVNEAQKSFLSKAAKYAQDRKPADAKVGIDRSAAVIGFVAEELRKNPMAEIEEVYERISLREGDDEKLSAVQDWVEEQHAAGDTGARQMQRAFDKVDGKREDFGIFDPEINPAFEDVDDDSPITGPPVSQNNMEIVPDGEDHVPDDGSYLQILNDEWGVLLGLTKTYMLKWWGDGDYVIKDKTSFLDDVAPMGQAIHPHTGRDVAAGVAWMHNSLRREFHGVTFDPSSAGKPSYLKGKKYFNTCKPFQVEPKEGADISPFLRVVGESITSTQEEAEYLLDYIAHLFQKPSQRPTRHPIFFGPKGTGKDYLFDILSTILPVGTTTEVELSRGAAFNSRYKSALLLKSPEAIELTHKATAAWLKDFLAKKDMVVNEKFLPEITYPFCARVFFSTNDITALPVETDERRYVPIQSTNKWRFGSGEVSREEHDAFWKEAWEGCGKTEEGRAALLWFFLNRDISNFNPYGHPSFLDNSELMDDMIAMHLSPEQEVWAAVLSGEMDMVHEMKTGGKQYVVLSDLIRVVQDWPTVPQYEKTTSTRKWASRLRQVFSMESKLIRVTPDIGKSSMKRVLIFDFDELKSEAERKFKKLTLS